MLNYDCDRNTQFMVKRNKRMFGGFSRLHPSLKPLCSAKVFLPSLKGRDLD